MCEERERLIGYVYDECDPAERRTVEEHLSTCHTCRIEIGGLRGVRQDLLAWEVPAHEPVWRPMAAAHTEPPWRSMPAWAMAVAAGLILMVGAAGGAATQIIFPVRTFDVARTSAEVQPLAAGLSADALSALEQRMLARMRAEMDERVRVASTPQPEAGFADVRAATTDLTRRVNALSSRQDEFSQVLWGVAAETIGIRSKQTGLEHNNRMLVSLVQGQSNSQGFSGGR